MWLYNNKQVNRLSDIPKGAVGFIYIIINKDTKQWYVGKKSLFSFRTMPPLKGYTRKRKVVKESDWVNYSSSNKSVKEWISPTREILYYAYSKKELTYREMQAIVCLNGLEDDKCLNENVLGKFFPKDLVNDKKSLE